MSSSSSSKGSSFWIFVSFSLLCEISVWFGFRIDFSFRLDANKPELYYEAEIEAIRGGESTMMYIDFSHVMGFNDALQKAIADEYLRFGFLSKTLTFLIVSGFFDFVCVKLVLGLSHIWGMRVRDLWLKWILLSFLMILRIKISMFLSTIFLSLKGIAFYLQILILNFSVWWLWWW